MEIVRGQTDILILGSGGAGLFAALHAARADPGCDITLAVKGLIGKCGCTRMVQGGYNVALNPGDSIERHFMDTINGGKWLPDQDLAWDLCVGAVERIRELENEIGCFFDRNPDGTLHQKAFAGQSFDRTAHKADLTGIEIINRLMEKTLALGLNALEEHRAIALIPAKDGSGVAGVLLIDMRTGGYRYIGAKAVLMATGAGPTMYLYHTPSGDKTCDGLAMMLEYGNGLRLRDMEMVQFHPTGLLGGPLTRMTGTVLEEGLRGAGGHLLNGEGARFMETYDPKAERATRDVVSRGIFSEMRAGRTGPMGGIFIKMGHLGPEKVAAAFPGMVKRCRDCGFDLAGEQVEVVPTAHYMMGGVEFNRDTTTAVPGLFAAGEDCGGVHGANRLGGNGVANSTVFGGIAGDSMAAFIKGRKNHPDPDTAAIDAAIAIAEMPFRRKADKAAGQEMAELRDALSRTMWDDVGIMRTAGGIASGLAKLDDYAAALDDIAIGDEGREFNLTWHDWLNMRSLTMISKAIAVAAEAREDSRGAHFREDFPDTANLDKSRFTCVSMKGDKMDLAMEKVRFTRVKPGESLIAE